MDEDLDSFSRDDLVTALKALRAAVREHRDATGHDLCWHHPAMWALLPEKITPDIAVPTWPRFMRGCIKYRQSLDTQNPDAPRSEREFGED